MSVIHAADIRRRRRPALLGSGDTRSGEVSPVKPRIRKFDRWSCSYRYPSQSAGELLTHPNTRFFDSFAEALDFGINFARIFNEAR